MKISTAAQIAPRIYANQSLRVHLLQHGPLAYALLVLTLLIWMLVLIDIDIHIIR